MPKEHRVLQPILAVQDMMIINRMNDLINNDNKLLCINSFIDFGEQNIPV